MAYTAELVEQRFDQTGSLADEAVQRAANYMRDLQDLLDSLELPNIDALNEVVFSPITSIDYSEIPKFTEVLGDFPSFTNTMPVDPILESIPGVNSAVIPIQNFNYQSASIAAPVLSEIPVPVEPSLSSISVASPPGFSVPEMPSLETLTLPDTPVLDMPDKISITDITLPNAPTPTLPDVPTLYELVFPSVPTLNIPDKITIEDFSIPASPNLALPDVPELVNLTMPNVPDIVIPEEPILEELAIPVPPKIDIANFDLDRPRIDMPNEPVGFSFTSEAYNSDLRIALFGKILTDIANGGTGLDIDVEQDLYDRFLARQQAENDRLYQEVQNQFTATGFGLPSGALASRLLQVSSEISLKNDQASREITINQAELAQKNTHFTVEQAGILERMLTEFYNSQQDRLLRSQEIMAANAIEIYNAIATINTLRLEQYKTEAQVFEAKVRAETIAFEGYRAQVDGILAAGELQKNKVDIYKTQIGAELVKSDIYKSEIDGVRANADIQKIKVDTYTAQANNQLARADLYKTELDGIRTKADIQKTKIDNYTAQIGAEMTSVDLYKAELEGLRSSTDVQKNQIDNYTAQLNGEMIGIELYKAELDGAKVQSDIQKNKADTYTAQVGAEMAKTEIYKTEVDGVRVASDIQKTQIDRYNSQINALNTIQKIYQTDLESTRIQTEIQNHQLDLFRTQTEIYARRVDAENTKVNLYSAQVGAEGIKGEDFKNEVQAYEAEIRGKLGVIEAQKIEAEIKLEENRNQIEKYKAQLEKYNTEINAEVKTADLAVSGYQANVSAFQAQTSVKEMEYKARMAETMTQIENLRVKLQKAVAMIESVTNGYIALKELQVKGTEGIMNANTQLAASAMNAVNASAGLDVGYSTSESHNHHYDES